MTSDTLPVDQFPQFASASVADYVGAVGPFIPIEGSFAAAVTHSDDGYMRLGRTFDLGGISAIDQPKFEAQFSIDTEGGYDHVIVEAQVVGSNIWTTLPDANGGTTADVPAECEAGFLIAEHPNLLRYLTPGDPCLPATATGSWNSFTGSYGEWTPVSFDLSAYAGQQVEVVISYITDPFTGGVGLLVDDTALVTNTSVTEAEGFEFDLGAWTVLGAPGDSPGNLTDFERTVGLGGIHSAISTNDTLLFGFGLEQLESAADRAAVAGAILDYLDP